MKPRDTHLDRSIATKVLPPGKVADPSRKTHFVQQTKAVQQPPPDHRVVQSFGSSLRLNPVCCGSPASFFERGKPVVGFTTLDPPDLGPVDFAALGAFGRWNVGPWSPAVEAIWEGKPPGG